VLAILPKRRTLCGRSNAGHGFGCTPGRICDWPPEALEDFRATRSNGSLQGETGDFPARAAQCTGLYILCHGAVKLYHSDRFGRDHILEIAGNGCVLGELPYDDTKPPLGNRPRRSLSRSSSICRASAWIHFVQKYPLTGVRLIGALSGELAAARPKGA